MANRKGTTLNLASSRKHSIIQTKVLYAKIQFIFGIILAVYIGLLVIVLLVYGGFQLQRSSILDAIGKEELKIAQLKSREELVHLIKYRASLLVGIAGKPWPQRLALENLITTRVADVDYLSFSLSSADTLLTVSGESAHYLAMQAYLDYLKVQVDSDWFTTATQEGIQRDEGGTYSITTSYLVKE